jgi:HD-like signal output (HDOD) protein
LVAAYLFPRELDEVLCQTPNDYRHIETEIQKYFGQSHYQMGYILLRKWQLPAFYLSVLQDIESIGPVEEQSAFVRCLRASQRICYLLLDEDADESGLDLIAEQAGLSFDEVMKVFRTLLDNKDNVQKLAAEIGG